MAEPDTTGIDPNSPDALVNFWLAQIPFAEKKLKSFRTRGNQIIRRYKNKRSTAVPTVTNVTVGQRRMNVLWANVQTQKPVLFAKSAKANVTRRNKDKDPAGRWAAIVLERVLNNSMDMQPFDEVIKQDVENLLLPGYGCSMIEYVPELKDNELGWQEARLRYVHWCDQITNPARYWQEVWYWGYVSYLTRAEVIQRYGQKIGAEIVLDHKASKDADDSLSKATIWCIWDSRSRKVIHISTGYAKAPLAEMDPPVKFDEFFPIPRPLVATTATDSIIPVPDFDQYQDQCDEIDIYTQRIYVLSRSLKVRAFYPGDMQSLRQLMDNSSDADMVPVENWAMFSERGGAQNVVGYFPIDMVAKTLQWCYEGRDRAMQAMYEITGISDILRGASDPNETLGGQQLKAQFAGVRIRDRQRDVQRYIRDHLRNMASIVGQHFTQEVIQKMSGAPLLTDQQKQATQMAMQAWQQYGQAAQQAQQAGMPPPPPPGIPQPPEEAVECLKEPSWEEVMAVLRDEKMRGFVVDVETDSTVEADQIGQQQKAEQFLTAIAAFMQAMVPILQAKPDLAPLVGELMMYGVRNFKAGETVETAIEEAVEGLEKQAALPPPTNPQAEADKAKAQTDITTAQLGQQTAQIKAGAETTKAKLSVVQSVIDHETKANERALQAFTPQEPQ